MTALNANIVKERWDMIFNDVKDSYEPIKISSKPLRTDDFFREVWYTSNKVCITLKKNLP